MVHLVILVQVERVLQHKDMLVETVELTVGVVEVELVLLVVMVPQQMVEREVLV